VNPSTPRTLARVTATLLVVLLTYGTAAGSGVSLKSKVEDARERLQRLGHRIREQEQAVARLDAAVSRLRDEIGGARNELASTQARVREAQAAVDAAQARLDALQARLDALARSAYISQPGGQFGTLLSVVLGSDSISDVYDGIEFSGSVAEPIASLLQQIQTTKADLDAKLAARQALESRQATLLQRLQTRQQERREMVDRARRALRSLTRTRKIIIGLARKLVARWHLRMFPIVGTAFPGPGHTSFGRWSVLFLRSLGAEECHSNEAVLIAWQLTEFTQAMWNPLATTTTEPGSTDFNDAGVQNFVSLDQGLAGTEHTLRNGAHGYGGILAALDACPPAMTTARAIRDSAWCSGCSNGNYVTANIPRVLADFRLYAAL
jgi:peptidoglycan hydrolase CwlO-like protein